MIAVMNHGVVEQLAPPREIYDRPATMFVANFIGSPPMNFSQFEGTRARDAAAIDINGATIGLPAAREDAPRRDADIGRPARAYPLRRQQRKLRGEVFGTEYLGTTQIVTVTTAQGMLKARVAAEAKARTGETVGLKLACDRLSLFDAGSGRAIRTALYGGGVHG